MDLKFSGTVHDIDIGKILQFSLNTNELACPINTRHINADVYIEAI